MDVFLSVLSVAGIILGAVLLIMIISVLLSAILYESVFGKRYTTRRTCPTLRIIRG